MEKRIDEGRATVTEMLAYCEWRGIRPPRPRNQAWEELRETFRTFLGEPADNRLLKPKESGPGSNGPQSKQTDDLLGANGAAPLIGVDEPVKRQNGWPGHVENCSCTLCKL